MKNKNVFNIQRRVYDSTALGTWLDCPTKFYFNWVRRIEPVVKSPALVFGSVMHDALQVWYETGDKSKALEMFDKIPKFIGDLNRTPERGRLLFEKYVERWAKESFKVLYVEKEFHILMPGGAIFAGRMDLVIEWDSRIYVMDHKTTRELGPTFFGRYRPEFQIDGYTFACRELLGSCDGCVINGLQVAKTVSKVERDISSRTPAEMDAYTPNFVRIVAGVERDICEKSFIKNTKQCSKYGSCTYKGLCLYGDDYLGPELCVVDDNSDKED